ncbi:MAG: hypothetical protein KGL39_29055 [Patescibacteria group bacterium]|nr:hypothetical protein [Patescibacteria group bacterium]
MKNDFIAVSGSVRGSSDMVNVRCRICREPIANVPLRLGVFSAVCVACSSDVPIRDVPEFDLRFSDAAVVKTEMDAVFDDKLINAERGPVVGDSLIMRAVGFLSKQVRAKRSPRRKRMSLFVGGSAEEKENKDDE